MKPTSDPGLNTVLRTLVEGIQSILGSGCLGVYLQGSFAIGDWDVHSDVDFTVAIDHDIPAQVLPDLQAMHGRIYDLDSNWAKHLEGSYFPKGILKRLDPALTALYYLDNGSRELVRSDHDNTLVVRWVVRELGIPLAGPDPRRLIDPVASDDLRREVLETMHDWAGRIFSGRYRIDNRWAQPFVVLSYCRMLQTLQTGRIHSKPAGARWAIGSLERRWAGLIRGALEDRPDPSLKVRLPADPDDIDRTKEFMRHALDLSGKEYGTIRQ